MRWSKGTVRRVRVGRYDARRGGSGAADTRAIADMDALPVRELEREGMVPGAFHAPRLVVADPDLLARLPPFHRVRADDRMRIGAAGRWIDHVEFQVEVPGSLIMVDHSIFRAFNKGALGMINVEGDENPTVFSGQLADDIYLPEGGAIQMMTEDAPAIAPAASPWASNTSPTPPRHSPANTGSSCVRK